MSEQIHDQVSAFMDDELSAEECAFLVRRLERDPDARHKLERYSLVGAALRSELLQPDPAMLQRRVHNALNGETAGAKPAVAAAAALPAARHHRWANPAFGAGIAATVAVAALFVVRTVNDVGVEPTASGESLRTAASAQAPSYVVPPGQQTNRAVDLAPPIRLTNYLMHHGEYASRLGRTSVHSNVVGATQAPVIIEAAATGTSAAAPPPLEREAQ